MLTVLGVAKSTYSVGPPGELYGGTISRTQEVGDRSDSRISYHVVQLIASREGPFGQLSIKLLSPFNFSHRGPLLGLAAAPLILAGPVRVTTSIPEQPWTVFDPEGFTSYRVTMIAMASCSLVFILGLARLFLSDEWSSLALLVTATSPFVIHEIYFTWPKLVSAAFVLIAAYLVVRYRDFIAGTSLGIGYLCHPAALLCLPGLLGLAWVKAPLPEAFPNRSPKKISIGRCVR